MLCSATFMCLLNLPFLYLLTDSECFERGIACSGPGTKQATGVQSAQECMRICQSKDACGYWIWWNTAENNRENACWTKSAQVEPCETRKDAISGPKFCGK